MMLHMLLQYIVNVYSFVHGGGSCGSSGEGGSIRGNWLNGGGSGGGWALLQLA